MDNKTRRCREPNCLEETYRIGAWLCFTHKKQRRKDTCSRYAKKNRKALSSRLKQWRTHTPKGFLCFVYSNMRNRIKGITGHPYPELWAGKPILPKNAFYSWALADKEYTRLFARWQASGRSRLDTPSIDRIDSNGGYVLGNMRWVTFEENSRNNGGSHWSDE